MIESERLIFREMEREDAKLIAEIMRDPQVQKVWEHYFSIEDAEDWIARRRAGYQKYGIDYLLAVLKETGEAVGQIGVLKEVIEGEEVWGIGYILKSGYTGNGYATEGAKAMAEYAFRVLKAPKVVCDIRPMNKASIAVAKRLGMVRTGSFIKRYQGMEMEHLVFELRREETEIQRGKEIER